MLKTPRSTESTIRRGKGGFGVGGDSDENGDHDGGGGCSGDSNRKFHPRLQLDSRATHLDAQGSSSTDSLSSAAQVVVKHDGVDGSGGKSVKKSSKSRRIVKTSEKLQRPEKLQRSLVRRNVYRSTDPPLKNSSFRFCWAQELSQDHFRFNY